MSVMVRTQDFGGFDPAMPYTDAVAMAIRGEVEGIMTPGGRLRYLRQLPPSERAPAPELEDEVSDSNSTAFARTNMGVYREPVREAIVRQDPWGNRTTRSSGEIVGHVYQHCALRQKRTPEAEAVA
jgi:hypothetical protein